jgi:hypothetical protein
MSDARKLFMIGIVLASSAVGSRGKNSGVTYQAKSNASGIITVDIESGSHIYWQYAIRPADGTVSRVSEKKISDAPQQSIPKTFAQPAGRITACRDHPMAKSPDGRYIATCVEVVTTSGEFSVKYSYSFIVTETETHNELVRWTPTKWRRIEGFAWSPDSKSVAELNMGEYYGKGPVELLSGMSGHPVPHNTVYLEVFEVGDWKQTEYLIRNNVTYAFTRIQSWQ